MLLKNLIILFLFICLLNFLLAGCGSDNSVNPSPVSVILSGTIIDNTTQSPVSGVILTNNLGNSVTSDSGGKFSFTFNSKSNYIISMSKTGYRGSLTGGYISANISQNVYMSPVNSDTMPVIQDIP